MAAEILSILMKKHFATILLMTIFAMKLRGQKELKDAERRYFWMTLTCCFLLVLQDVAESLASLNPALRLFRIFFSIVGYALRPVAAVGLLLVVLPSEKRTWRIWILCFVNLAVFLTAFFSPIAFYFDEDYGFVRGPLGYCVFVVAFLYMVQIIYWTWRRYYEGKDSEQLILIICAASCIVGAVIDMIYGGCRLNEAIMVNCVFFDVFLNAHDIRHDILTSLKNRYAFFDDIEQRQKSVTAIASLDMNGLKEINDAHGHAAGDEALAAIGRCLNQISSRNTATYRIGGDEFVIVFLRQNEDAVAKAVTRAREQVEKAGYSISTGYAMRADGETMEDLLQKSDHAMYGNKAAYYRQKGNDRRRR